MEYASAIAKGMIEMLLNVHALTNMHRASDRDDYRRSAAGWIPLLEFQMQTLKEQLQKPEEKREVGGG